MKFGGTTRAKKKKKEDIFDILLVLNARVVTFLACENILAPCRWGRFTRRNVCDPATEIPYW